MATDERKDDVQNPQISDLTSKKVSTDEAGDVKGGMLKKTAAETIEYSK
jgi:hypothetical protein